MSMWIMLFVACSSEPEAPAPVPAAPAPEAPKEAPPAPKENLGKATHKEMVEADCNATLQSLGFVEGDVVKIKCADGCVTGTIYGTDVYTADSRVCTAGVHAGAIPATGGSFKAKIEGTMPSFEASTRNGIESRSWSTEWGPTFRVQGRGDKG